MFTLAMILYFLAHTASANILHDALAECMSNVDIADDNGCVDAFTDYFVELDVDGDEILSADEREAMWNTPIDEVAIPAYFPEGSNDKCTFEHFCDKMITFKYPELPIGIGDDILGSFCEQEQRNIEETCENDWNLLFPEKVSDPNEETSLSMTKTEYREAVMSTMMSMNGGSEDWTMEQFLAFIHPTGTTMNLIILEKLAASGSAEIVRIEDYVEPVNDCIRLNDGRRELFPMMIPIAITIIGVIVSSMVSATIDTVSQGGNAEDWAVAATAAMVTNSVTATCCAATGLKGCIICGSLGGLTGSAVGTRLCEMRKEDGKLPEDTECYQIEAYMFGMLTGAAGGAGGYAADAIVDGVAKSAGRYGMAALGARLVTDSHVGAAGSGYNYIYNTYLKPPVVPRDENGKPLIIPMGNDGNFGRVQHPWDGTELTEVTNKFTRVDSLGLCEGHCRTDRDCVGGYKCYIREYGKSYFTIPGCTGWGPNQNYVDNYCYDPSGAFELKQSLPSYLLTLVDAHGYRWQNLGACHNKCTGHWSCRSGLSCFKRNAGHTIPGCFGSGGGDDWDYCYDTNWKPMESYHTGRWGDRCAVRENDITDLDECRNAVAAITSTRGGVTGEDITSGDDWVYGCSFELHKDGKIGRLRFNSNRWASIRGERIEVPVCKPLERCIDASGIWTWGDYSSHVVFIKSSKCRGTVPELSLEYKTNVETVEFSNGLKGTMNDKGEIEWDNGFTYVRYETIEQEDVGVISLMVYQSGTNIGNSQYVRSVNVVDEGLTVGEEYLIDFEILRNDLGNAHEYVTSAKVGTQEILKDGECHPDGGDYDCTFFKCDVKHEGRVQKINTGTIQLSISLVGHEKDCDCIKDDNPKNWECFSEHDHKAGAEPMVAVGRFTFTPIRNHDDSLLAPYAQGVKLNYVDGVNVVSTFRGSSGDKDAHIELYTTHPCNCPVGKWNHNAVCLEFPCDIMNCQVLTEAEVPQELRGGIIPHFRQQGLIIYDYHLPGSCGRTIYNYCVDTPGWTNTHGFNCAHYESAGWCEYDANGKGGFNRNFEWTGTPDRSNGFVNLQCMPAMRPGDLSCADAFNYPAMNCCACGKKSPYPHLDTFDGVKTKVYLCNCPHGEFTGVQEGDNIRCRIQHRLHVPTGYATLPVQYKTNEHGRTIEEIWSYMYTLPTICKGKVTGN